MRDVLKCVLLITMSEILGSFHLLQTFIKMSREIQMHLSHKSATNGKLTLTISLTGT